MKKVTLDKRSICTCGFATIVEDVPLGSIYTIDESTMYSNFAYGCGGCGQLMHKVMCVKASQVLNPGAPMLYLPHALFSTVTEQVQWVQPPSKVKKIKRTKLKMDRIFSKANLDRCQSPKGFNHPIHGWSMSDWMVAVMGELGEAANIVKKLNRVRDGVPGNDIGETQLRANLKDEIADAYIYLDLFCTSAGIDLRDAVIAKFNKSSEKIGYEKRL